MLKRIMTVNLSGRITWILLILLSIFLHYFEVYMYCSTHWLRAPGARTLMCISGLSVLAALFLLWTLFAPVKSWFIRIAIAICVVLLHGFCHPTL